MLFGRNPAAEILLAMLNLTPSSVGRFRDCYPSEDGERIIVYTRNGGGNREEYQGVLDDLKSNPNWLQDYDDDYDCTYASIEFSVPTEFKELVKEIADQTSTVAPAEKWQNLMQDLSERKDSAAASRALEVGKRIFGVIESALPGTHSISSPEGSIVVANVPPK